MPGVRKNSKLFTLDIIMGDPDLKKRLRDAWDSPVGSTKRKQARSTMRVLRMSGRKYGFDGKGQATPDLGTSTQAGLLGTASSSNARIPDIASSTPGAATSTKPIQPLAPFESPGVFDPVSAAKAVAKGAWNVAKWPVEKIIEAKGGWNVAMGKKVENIWLTGASDDGRMGIPDEGINWMAAAILKEDAGKYGAPFSRDFIAKNRLDQMGPGLLRVLFQGVKSGKRKLGQKTDVTVPQDETTATTTAATTDKTEETAFTFVGQALAGLVRDKDAYLAKLNPAEQKVANIMFGLINKGYSYQQAMGVVTKDRKLMKQLFPDTPEDQLPYGAYPEEAMDKLRKTLDARYNIEGRTNDLISMVERGAYLEKDISGYIENQDEYIRDINGQLENLLAKRRYGGEMLGGKGKVLDTFITTLTNERAKQNNRYVSLLNSSVDLYEKKIAASKDNITIMQNMINRELTSAEPLTKARYEKYTQYFGNIYTEMAFVSDNKDLSAAATVEKMKVIKEQILEMTSMAKALGTTIDDPNYEDFLVMAGFPKAKIDALIKADTKVAGTKDIKINDAVAGNYMSGKDVGDYQVTQYDLGGLVDQWVSEGGDADELRRSWGTAARAQIDREVTDNTEWAPLITTFEENKRSLYNKALTDQRAADTYKYYNELIYNTMADAIYKRATTDEKYGNDLLEFKRVTTDYGNDLLELMKKLSGIGGGANTVEELEAQKQGNLNKIVEMSGDLEDDYRNSLGSALPATMNMFGGLVYSGNDPRTIFDMPNDIDEATPEEKTRALSSLRNNIAQFYIGQDIRRANEEKY